jgi:hypothetical protein
LQKVLSIKNCIETNLKAADFHNENSKKKTQPILKTDESAAKTLSMQFLFYTFSPFTPENTLIPMIKGQ